MSDDKESAKEKKPSWQYTSTALKNALNAWEELSQKAETLSADEKMIQDMQKLLVDLQVKIKELSVESPTST